jgi:hypothetical protein
MPYQRHVIEKELRDDETVMRAIASGDDGDATTETRRRGGRAKTGY